MKTALRCLLQAVTDVFHCLHECSFQSLRLCWDSNDSICTIEHPTMLAGAVRAMRSRLSHLAVCRPSHAGVLHRRWRMEAGALWPSRTA